MQHTQAVAQLHAHPQQTRLRPQLKIWQRMGRKPNLTAGVRERERKTGQLTVGCLGRVRVRSRSRETSDARNERVLAFSLSLFLSLALVRDRVSLSRE